MPDRHALFCYGTLCIPQIMQSVAGYKIPGKTATLKDYQCLSLFGFPYPAVIYRTGKHTDGILYTSLTKTQLYKIDAYETRQYVRTRVNVNMDEQTGCQAWTYVLHPRYYRQVQRRPWLQKEFRSRYLRSYLHRHGW